MGVIDKLKFWKKDDEFGAPINDTSSYDLGSQNNLTSQSNTIPNDPMGNPDSFGQPDPLHNDSFSSPHEETDHYGQYPQGPSNYPQPTPFPGQPRSVPQEYRPEAPQTIQQRDIELILAKLDGLKSELDALHQRIKKIEQYTDQHSDQQPVPQKKYW